MASSFLRFLDHTQRRTTVGRTLLWTSDQLVAESSTYQHTTLTTDIHAPGGIRTHDLSRRAAADLRLRTRGHWDRRQHTLTLPNITMMWITLLCCWLTRIASTHHKPYFCTARTSRFVTQSLLLVYLYDAFAKNVLRNTHLP